MDATEPCRHNSENNERKEEDAHWCVSRELNMLCQVSPSLPCTGVLPACKDPCLLQTSCQGTSMTGRTTVWDSWEREWRTVSWDCPGTRQEHVHHSSVWHRKPSGRMLRDMALERAGGEALMSNLEECERAVGVRWEGDKNTPEKNTFLVLRRAGEYH